MAVIFVAQALDSKGRPMIDPALSDATEDKQQAEIFYDWLVKGGWPAELLAIS